MRALIFNEHFKYIFKNFKSFKQILYLKENLSWEKSLLDNLNQFFSNRKKIFGYLHTPVRYWDLKLSQIDQNIHTYPKEDLLVCSLICKKKLQNKLDNRNNIHLVESLRFPSNNKIKKAKFDGKKNSKKFLLLGSFNEQSTQNMINQILDYIRVYKKNIKIDLKLHPLSNININLDKKLINITKLDLRILLRNNKYEMIFLDSDSSISLELILSNFNFLIYKDPDNLNTSFLRNNKKFKFFSNYKQIKTISKNSIQPTNNKKFEFLNSNKYLRWKKILN
jgi:surface carbohydrate biosynthesis protein (TIGR04326 family)